MKFLILLLFFASAMPGYSQWFPSSAFATDAIQGIEIGAEGTIYLWLNEQNGSQVHHIVKSQSLDAPATTIWSRKQDSISDGLRGLWVMPNDVLLWTERGIESATKGTIIYSCWDKLLTLDALVPISDTSVLSAATVSFQGDSGSTKALMRCFRAGESGSCQEILATSPRERLGRVTCIGVDSKGEPLLSFGWRKNADKIRVSHWFIYKGDTLQLNGLNDLDVYDPMHVSKTNFGWVFVMNRVVPTTASGETTNNRIIETDADFNVIRNVELGVSSMSTIKKAIRRGDLILVAADSAVYVYAPSKGLIQTVTKEEISKSAGIEDWNVSLRDVDVHNSRLYIVGGSGVYVTNLTTTSVLDEVSPGSGQVMPIVDAEFYYEGSVDGSESEIMLHDLLGRRAGQRIVSSDKRVLIDLRNVPNGVYNIISTHGSVRTILVSH